MVSVLYSYGLEKNAGVVLIIFHVLWKIYIGLALTYFRYKLFQ